MCRGKGFLFLLIITITVFQVVYSDNAGGFKVDYWVTNVRGGISYPTGEFANYVNPSYNFGFSVRKGLDMELSVGGGINYAVLPYKLGDAPNPFNVTMINLEAAFTPYVPDFFIWPYVRFGLGAFILKYVKVIGKSDETQTTSGSETTIGIMLGGGAIYPIGNQFGINVDVMYNHSAMGGGTGDVNSFLTIDAGVIMFFK